MFRPSNFILGLLIAVCTMGASAQFSRSTIIGTVKGPDGKALDRAQIELKSDATMSAARTTTNASGRFTFNNIVGGRYTIRVYMPGSDLQEQSEAVQIGLGGSSSGSETIQLDFTLRPPAGRVRNAAVVFAQDIPEEAKKLFDSAVSELKRENPQVAVNDLVKAIAIFPTYFAALELLGIEYTKHEMYPDARKAFSEAVAVNSRSYNSWYGLAFANMGLKKWADAVAAAEQALVIDKESSPAYFVLGMSQRSLKQYEAAERSLLRAKEFDKARTGDIHWNLALLYAHNLKKYGKAADELELFLKASPANPDIANINKLIADFRAKQSSGK